MIMRVAVASDHAGFSLKGKVAEYLGSLGHIVEDLGTCDTTPVDYPDFAEAVATAVLSKRVERAVLICGSGVGASVARTSFEVFAPACATTRTPRTRASSTIT